MRRHRAHYDVTVMMQVPFKVSLVVSGFALPWILAVLQNGPQELARSCVKRKYHFDEIFISRSLSAPSVSVQPVTKNLST